MVIIQKIINITQEKIFHTIGSNHIKSVVALSNIENITIENIRDSIIIYGLYLSSGLVVLAQSITGKSGKTQGARIVKTQARNDTIKIVINQNKKIR